MLTRFLYFSGAPFEVKAQIHQSTTAEESSDDEADQSSKVPSLPCYSTGDELVEIDTEDLLPNRKHPNLYPSL